jgi:hypothetical protein
VLRWLVFERASALESYGGANQDKTKVSGTLVRDE